MEKHSSNLVSLPNRSTITKLSESTSSARDSRETSADHVETRNRNPPEGSLKLINGQLARWFKRLYKLKCRLCHQIILVTSDELLNEVMLQPHQINWWWRDMMLHLKSAHVELWQELNRESHSTMFKSSRPVMAKHDVVRERKKDNEIIEKVMTDDTKRSHTRNRQSKKIVPTVTLTDYMNLDGENRDSKMK